MRIRVVSLLVLAPLGACSPGANALFQGCKTMASNADLPISPAIDTLKLKETASGLGIEEVREGTGVTAEAGNVVAVHYTGWLTDGSKFDSSRDRGEPLVFPLGRGQVIQGWDEGVSGMKVGGRRKLVIPSRLAYGAAGAGGVIPPNATLIFDVELCQVR